MCECLLYYTDSSKVNKLICLLIQDTVSLARDVHLDGTHYVKGMVVSSGQRSGLPEFYKILNIVVNLQKVSFVTSKLSYRSYQVIDCDYVDI